MKYLYFLLVFACWSESVSSQESIQAAISATNIQNGFLKNMGQVRDFKNKAVDFVYYQASIGGQQVFLTNYGLAIQFSRVKKITRVGGLNKSKNINRERTIADSLSIVNYEMERIDIVLKNASIKPANIISSVNPRSPKYNLYFDEYKSNEDGLRLQSELLIKNVYPGIDWKIYIKVDASGIPTLKYDFIVHPGADASHIQLKYSKNAKLSLSGSEIMAETMMGKIKEDKPYSFLQEDLSEINVSYKLNKNSIGFNVVNYDKKKTLVIDPSIFWLTYLTSTDPALQFKSVFGNDIETDASGNIFVQLTAGGNTPFPIINPGDGAYYQDYTAAPNGSMIISKFAPEGQMLWSTYFGNWVGGQEMTIDKFGNIITLGVVLNSTPSFPNPNPNIPLLDNGGYFDPAEKQYFLAKFSNGGKLTWCSWYVNFSSYPTDMSYDINGNFYVVGSSEVNDFPVADPGGGAYVVNAQFGWAKVLFISQFDASNKLTWSTRIEGRDYDPFARVCTDKSGNIYLGGHTRSTNYPLVNAGGYFNGSSWGSVITRFNAARQMTWSTYFLDGFSFTDLTTDADNNLYVSANQRILKFNSSTQLVFEKTINTTQNFIWDKINYDPFRDQIQLLGVMNDSYSGFPTINTVCNGKFFNDGISPHTYNNATGPIFGTMQTDGEFIYRSLTDWPYEYYNYNEMTVDPFGDPVYLFGHNTNALAPSNPQLTNPGFGAYFDPRCCAGSGSLSAMLLKLTTSELSVTTEINAAGCCNGTAKAIPHCGLAPFTYEWSTGDSTEEASNLCPGDYWVKVTDANHLSRTEHINIPHPPGSITSIICQVIPENCDRSNATINIQSTEGGTAPFTYSIDGLNFSASPNFFGLDSGNYIVRVKDANGCIFKDTIPVLRVTGPSSVSYITTPSSCNANDGVLDVTNVLGGVGPYKYSLGAFEDANGNFINLAPATYQLIVIDTAGCQLSIPIVISKANSATDVNFIAGSDHCNQGIGFIKVDNVVGGISPFTFSIDSISFTTDTIKNLKAGNYTLFVKDANGCILKKDPIVVNNDSGPSKIDFRKTDAVCGKTTGEIKIDSVQGGVSPYLYSIDGTGYSINGNFTGVQLGQQTIYVKDAYGCIYSENFKIDFVPIVSVNLSPADTSVCLDQNISLKLIGDVGQLNSISWSIPAQGYQANFKVADETKVYVTIIDKNNCLIKDSSIIRVTVCNGPEKCIAIPTAFTPNHDGKNETIGPLTNGCRVESIFFQIYNRWGQLLFETNKPGTGWNGIYKGLDQPAGVYMFVCRYTGDDGINRSQKGTFLLIR